MLIIDEIVDIEEIKCKSRRYDITVDDNHNFFANGILVHNCQNLTAELEDWKARELHWERTEKLDGTSMTVYYNNVTFGVCGRNWELAETDTNSLWRAARTDKLEEKLSSLGRNLAIQGELVGEGIQNNPYKLKGQHFYVFDMFDISTGQYISSLERIALVGHLGIKHVPIEGTDILTNDITSNILVQRAEGKSKVCVTTDREGLVYKCLEDPGLSFKTISNRYLIKNDG